MEKDAVLKIREVFRNTKFTLTHRKTGEKKQFVPTLHVCLDNSLNMIDDNEGSLIWDDENEIMYWIRANTPSSFINSPTSGMSMGTKSEWPFEIIAANFEQIQNMRILLNEEAYDSFCDNISNLITEEEKQNNYIRIAEETDMYAVITRKGDVNYNTGLPKNYDVLLGINKKNSADESVHLL